LLAKSFAHKYLLYHFGGVFYYFWLRNVLGHVYFVIMVPQSNSNCAYLYCSYSYV